MSPKTPRYNKLVRGLQPSNLKSMKLVLPYFSKAILTFILSLILTLTIVSADTELAWREINASSDLFQKNLTITATEQGTGVIGSYMYKGEAKGRYFGTSVDNVTMSIELDKYYDTNHLYYTYHKYFRNKIWIVFDSDTPFGYSLDDFVPTAVIEYQNIPLTVNVLHINNWGKTDENRYQALMEIDVSNSTLGYDEVPFVVDDSTTLELHFSVLPFDGSNDFIGFILEDTVLGSEYWYNNENKVNSLIGNGLQSLPSMNNPLSFVPTEIVSIFNVIFDSGLGLIAIPCMVITFTLTMMGIYAYKRS